METKNGFTFKRKSTSKLGNVSINISDRIGHESASENEFVFKRVSTNKKISLKNNTATCSVAVDRKKAKEKKKSFKIDKKEIEDNKLSSKLEKDNIDELYRLNLMSNIQNENLPNSVKGKENLKRNSRKNGGSKTENIQPNAENSLLKFNVVKKRKTIHLDKSIDISSSSIVIDDRAVVENCIKNNNFIDNNDLSLNDNNPNKDNLNNEEIDFKSKNTNQFLDIDDIIKSNPLSSFEQLKKEIRAERVKSGEIYKKVNSNNINDLIKGCIGFLSTNTPYSNEIVKHCNSNFFSDIDYRREIESTNTKIELFKAEIKKWNSIFELEKAKNIDFLTKESKIPDIIREEEFNSENLNSDPIEIDNSNLELENENNNDKNRPSITNRAIHAEKVPNINEPVGANINKKSHTDTLKMSNEQLCKEFEDKSRRLRSLDLKIKLFLENAKEKSENLLRNVFDSIEDRSGDAMFLLKAMSKLGR